MPYGRKSYGKRKGRTGKRGRKNPRLNPNRNVRQPGGFGRIGRRL